MILYQLINDCSVIATKDLEKMIMSPDFDRRAEPIVFKATLKGGVTTPEWVVIAHGEPGKPEFFDSVAALREWLNTNTAINENDIVNLVSCFSGTMNKDEIKDNKFEIIETYYPIIMPSCFWHDDEVPVLVLQNEKDMLEIVTETAKQAASNENLEWDSLPQHKKDNAINILTKFFMRGKKYMEVLAKKEANNDE